MRPSHDQIYERARCYDIDFGFRDVAAECDALVALATQYLGRAPSSVLELASGPARHACEFARRGLAATALDAVPAMLDYASALAAREGVSLAVACADMVDFTLPTRFDLVVLLMDSSSYLLDNNAFCGISPASPRIWCRAVLRDGDVVPPGRVWRRRFEQHALDVRGRRLERDDALGPGG